MEISLTTAQCQCRSQRWFCAIAFFASHCMLRGDEQREREVFSMRWVVGLLLWALVGYAMADEDAEELKVEQPVVGAYEQVTVRFNTNVQRFSSWEVFKAEVFSRLPVGTSGRCYEPTEARIKPVNVTTILFQEVTGNRWQKTSGNGWRQYKNDRTFIEYRVNEKAGVLLRAEGVKPRFFFAGIKKICEFPLRPSASGFSR
jgi:hypothetical protein